MKKRIKNIILNWLLKHLFNSITERDVLTVVGREVHYKNTLLTPQQRNGIIEEARVIKNLALWSILLDEIKYSCNKRIYTHASTTDDIVFGKAGLWIVDIIEQKVRKLSDM